MKKIFLAAISTVFVLLVLELTFRIFSDTKFKSMIYQTTEDWEGSEVIFNKSAIRLSRSLGYEHVANSKSLGTNSLGMLDKERLEEKSKDSYRIICLGDSTTAYSDYTRILEKLLNTEKEDKFEVWNCGVSGYAIIQYCRALKEKWLKYKPDIVIIGFCLNDFTTTPLVIKENNRFVGYFPYEEILPNVNPLLLKHSALYRFIIARIFFTTKDYDNQIRLQARFYLQEVKDLLAAKDIRFLITILGYAERFENYPSDAKKGYAEIKKIIQEYNIESIDTVPLFEEFLENNEPKDLSSYDEIHFNYKGSEIVAKAMYGYLNRTFHED